jgi:phage/plasmid-like protein (TIGR03299 family)
MITEDDGMMYCGEVPWHGLGVKVDHLATSAEALEAAKLAWRVSKQPMQLENGRAVPDHKAVVRDDIGAVLGVVGRQYTPLQNVDAFAFADLLLPGAEGRYETAGSLMGGRRVWMLAKLGEADIVPGDPVTDYLLLSNSHDGTSSFRVLQTSVRVVCNNTLTMALGARTEHAIAFKHTAGAIAQTRLEDAQAALGLVDNMTRFFHEVDRELTRHRFTRDFGELFLDEMVPVPSGVAGTDRGVTIAQKKRAALLDLVETGKGNDLPEVRGSLYALKNACTDYTDHYARVRNTDVRDSRETRMNMAVFGSGAAWKVKAVGTICRMAGIAAYAPKRSRV